MDGPEWPGAAPRWHIQGHQRDQILGGPGPQGPAHWPRRPHDIGGFCDSVVETSKQGMKHAYDPPSAYVPAPDRSRKWNFARRPLAAYRPEHERITGTRRVEPNVPVDNLGWTGKYANYTGPRHYAATTTTIQPGDNTTTGSFYVEKIMGTKKAVLSSSMGLADLYDDGERRNQRPAVEWSLDAKMQRKIRIRDLEDKRNGIGVANPGDKGYGTSEHAPEYFDMMRQENRGRGNMVRRVMSKVDKSWNMSGADPMLDKKGRRMSDYIQIYCKTPYRKNSMYIHRNAEIKEIADMAGEGGSKKMHIFFQGNRVQMHHRLLELGIGALNTVELMVEEDRVERKIGFREKEATRAVAREVGDVGGLDARPKESDAEEGTPGLKWRAAGQEKPSGTEIENAGLTKALQAKLQEGGKAMVEFTQEEWDALQAPAITWKNCIKVGDKYWKPAKEKKSAETAPEDLEYKGEEAYMAT